ncbi:MAG: LON peptidase substrate-binding domain-containing protein [Minwuia sp.]|uniref:LON peptidase substrate-binding domain-containing protein n=1 Tax=Minwuia sp. TaxID=2493630 RepID=UPI003A880F3B
MPHFSTMTSSERPNSPANLPERIPIFPLPGAILLPGGRLPLNIFEPRYLAMIRDAMSGPRMIGMIQPSEEHDGGPEPPVYDIGCLGRIVDYSETDDGRYLIALAGVCRFRVKEELSRDTPYRQILADYEPFKGDFASGGKPAAIDRDRLVETLRQFLDSRGLKADWDAAKRASDTVLVNSLSMVLPLAPPEKQALLEAADIARRAEVMVTLMQMALLEGDDGDTTVQ